MTSAQAQPDLKPEQYLAAEKASPIKHEYIDGQVYAMAGASDAHVMIVANLTALLRPHLRGTTCRLYPTDMKVQIRSRNCYYYPDLLVTCDQRDRENTYYKHYPKIIIEVLSEGTEAFDRGDKFEDYSELETLQDYVLVSQDRCRVDYFQRNQDGVWFLTRYRAGDRVYFASLALDCAITTIYEDVVLAA